MGFKYSFCTFFSSNIGSCPLDKKNKFVMICIHSVCVFFVPCVCFLCQEAWRGEGAACRGGDLRPRRRNGVGSHLVTVPGASPKSFIRNSKLGKPKVVFITNFRQINTRILSNFSPMKLKCHQDLQPLKFPFQRNIHLHKQIILDKNFH